MWDYIGFFKVFTWIPTVKLIDGFTVSACGQAAASDVRMRLEIVDVLVADAV